MKHVGFEFWMKRDTWYLSSIPADVEAIAAHVNARYSPERVRLPGVPELNGIVPTGADQFVGRFRVEAGAEHSRFVTVHNFQWIAKKRK